MHFKWNAKHKVKCIFSVATWVVALGEIFIHSTGCGNALIWKHILPKQKNPQNQNETEPLKKKISLLVN
jgi:hypothetical protein